MVSVTLETTAGNIKIDMYGDMPITVGNFVKLAKEGFYDGTIFHRVIDGFMVQGGCPEGTGCGGPGYNIEDELVHGHPNNRGTISMANTGRPNTGGSQFFINLVNNNYLDWDNPLAPYSHPVFGEVADDESMAVVDAIGKMKTGRNDRPLNDITIKRVLVEESDPMSGKGRRGGRHVMEALGKARVVIDDGKVVEVGEPVIKFCPLFYKRRGIEEFNEKSIRENMQFRVDDFGMCSDGRQIRMDYFLNLGISEILSLAVSKGMLDAAVIAADGCGTVVLKDPNIIQGLGGRISGIIETCPEPSVIEGVGRENVLYPETADIDQFGGVHKAFAMRNNRVGVTVASAEDAQAIRDCYGDSVCIFAVHTTGVSKKEAETLFDTCDVITACASKPIRELAPGRALLQAGTKVPVYASSQRGAELIKAKLDELGREPDTVLEDGPMPLI